ncbi:POT family proton-dependent oligopeptide transporter [Oikeobacillus pervagus]|uniref:POT family proton-dependent oligopeptide transporter n=1 Tax=Oikeobacillus pervagus TaxID=1325931 RepID=A0AAJ1T0H6_9BACI|nr:peptide MFS transporter [Oikeobacillus pervagus]MDQ0216334.1 POT family proton-dependent oligopeptide transporter [Oikeobacillus pervagus]
MSATTDEQHLPLHSKKKEKHPPGLYLLFLTEMWERFSYYGMRAILVLYLTKSLIEGGLGMNNKTAMLIYGIFTGTVYFMPLLGGYLSDRFLGRRLAITLGGITMAIGNFVLFSNQSETFLYLGLALLIIGNGFFKPNISTLVGELYGDNDPRRDAAFTIFYMGINIGAFFSPLIIGYISEDLLAQTVNGITEYGYRYGFLVSSIGMIIGQIIFNLLGNRYLGDIGKKPVGAPSKDEAGNKHTAPLTKKEKQRTAVIFILAAFVVFFWAGFEQAGASLTLYTEKFIDREIFGWTIPVSWFQSVNPAFIVLLAPLVSALWLKLSKSKRGDLPVPTKMAMGMILLGLGFGFLIIATLQTGSDPDHVVHKANLMFIIMTYLFHTLGELFLSPVGLSLVSRIAPVKLASLLMGVWLTSSGFANYLAGYLGTFTQSLGYLEVFALIGGVATVLGLILLTLSKKLVKMMD